MAMTQPVAPGPNKIAWAEPCEQNPSSCIHPGPSKPASHPRQEPEPKRVRIRAKRISPPISSFVASFLVDQPSELVHPHSHSRSSQTPHANYPGTSLGSRNTDRCRRPGLVHLFRPSSFHTLQRLSPASLFPPGEKNTQYQDRPRESQTSQAARPPACTWEAPSSPLSAGPRCCCRADNHSPAIPELGAHNNKESSAKYKYQTTAALLRLVVAENSLSP